jgi:hypothetical protein
LDFVDIFSKADVVQHLSDLAKVGQVKECLHLKVRKLYASAFYPKCAVEWARCIPADNVATDDLASSAPSSYGWPECPADCPKYLETPNFVQSLAEPVSNAAIASADAYVHRDRLAQLKAYPAGQFDLAKLVAFCEELNVCNQNNLVLAPPMLVRAILDHVPPIFGCKSFSEVANNCPGSKSFKGAMNQLENTSRKIADSVLHTQIRKKEALPTETQVDFRNGLDMLLQEIVRLLKE